ncbi:hypothetical protein THIOKS13430001 [Thiocapsa sp. KS1]|nr:hypothetical protein THIOKS13430001 [Thiocapsa sp. KS1]
MIKRSNQRPVLKGIKTAAISPQQRQRCGSNQRPVLKGIKTGRTAHGDHQVRSNQRPVLKGIKTDCRSVAFHRFFEFESETRSKGD